ncbi:MAG: hypothetical protein U0X39_16335 [Bacteroidales bacterium]
MKNGEKKPFLFSAEAIQIAEERYLLTTYNEVHSLEDKHLKHGTDLIIDEIFETVSATSCSSGFRR